MEEIHTAVEVPGGTQDAHPPAGFPPFDSAAFASQLLWLALTFGLLYLLMSKISLPRVKSILDVRQDRISTDLAEAQRLKDESDAAQVAYEKALAAARNAAQALAATTRDKLNAESDISRRALEAELNARLAAAEEQINLTKAAALLNVHSIAVDAAGTIVEQLLGSAPKSGDVEKAVGDVLKAA
jgi:F-type H+-transporting ATPase subunit b